MSPPTAARWTPCGPPARDGCWRCASGCCRRWRLQARPDASQPPDKKGRHQKTPLPCLCTGPHRDAHSLPGQSGKAQEQGRQRHRSDRGQPHHPGNRLPVLHCPRRSRRGDHRTHEQGHDASDRGHGFNLNGLRHGLNGRASDDRAIMYACTGWIGKSARDNPLELVSQCTFICRWRLEPSRIWPIGPIALLAVSLFGTHLE